jgi:predicted glycogen debranching enzyme
MGAVIEIGADLCRAPDAAARREWLETNGLGGYASGTVAGLHTRRYHGLLVAALSPPTGRMLLLSKLEETLVIDGQRYELGANQYPGIVHPQGYRYLTRFRLDPFPEAIYSLPGGELARSLCMVHGENCTVVRYWFRPGEAAAPARVELELRPLIAYRDHHSTTHENSTLNGAYREEPGAVVVAPYAGLPQLFLAHDAAGVEPAGYWYRRFEYAEERARGLDFEEDLYNPCVLRFDLSQRPTASLIASLERREAGGAAGYLEQERQRRAALAGLLPAGDPLVAALSTAADQFLAARGEGQTVIAGYHWFTDWGRDTMIALPGLTLATGRPAVAGAILQEFAGHVSEGMLPNRFPDAGEAPEYNTVDASLWYFQAVHAFLKATGELDFVREELYGPLGEILDWHERGTRYGIRVDTDGLLASGAPGVQLTWMDAKVGTWVVTPRQGKPVEIQALWHNAVRVMQGLAERLGDAERAGRCEALAERARRSFNAQFWNAAAGCLYDAVDGETRDASLRPNQLLAVSLPHSLLSRQRARQVVAVVERELLTPYGPRSLAPSDPRYRGRYEGDVWARDGSYHQGAVWPWLMGPFLTAYVKAHGGASAARARARRWLAAFHDHLGDAGLGQVSEILDGDPPHTPRGCIAQAWSVAELLRAALELR